MDSIPDLQTHPTIRRSSRLATRTTVPVQVDTVPVSSTAQQKRRNPKPKQLSESEPNDIEDFCKEEAEGIRERLLLWYDENQRELPWRKSKKEGNFDREERERRAYEVWVSEIMLQQTRVSAVIGYYNRWMSRWPTVESLANATQEEVNEMWAGLGYYRRARFLLEGAKSIVKNGKFPKNAKELQKVPGIGNYTAGAIASIAFNEAVPVVDGNVVRVMTRLKAISSNPKESSTVKLIWDLARQIVDQSRPGDFNQALMELGATQCQPTNPNCSTCPLSPHCLALSLSKNNNSNIKVTDFPLKVVKTKPRNEFAAVCVVIIQTKLNKNELNLNYLNENKCFYLLMKRPQNGLLAGLWEFPSVLVEEKKTHLKNRREKMDEYLRDFIDFEFDLEKREEIGEYLHIFSHIRLLMHVELMILNFKGNLDQFENQGQIDSLTWKFVEENSMEPMALTSGIRKVYNMVQDFKMKKVSHNETKPKRKIKKAKF
ncbi:hypothetical protein LUZ60_007470 [Juncus effusus]|nr:hypothetical protein LUZ60_007470 [Juncus effusus]